MDNIRAVSYTHLDVYKRQEVTLKYEVPCKGFILSVEGRADGIIDTPSGIVIDEIKGVLKDLDMIKEPVAVHLAQAKCYAYKMCIRDSS